MKLNAPYPCYVWRIVTSYSNLVGNLFLWQHDFIVTILCFFSVFSKMQNLILEVVNKWKPKESFPFQVQELQVMLLHARGGVAPVLSG